MGMRRREFLGGVAAAAVAPAAGFAQSSPSGADAALARAFDQALDELLRRSPEIATECGLDHGARSGARGRLDDRSIAAVHAGREQDRDTLRRWRSMDRGVLSPRSVVQFNTYDRILQLQLAVSDQLGACSGSPYVVTQLDGAYQKIPNFLESKHPVETKADADFYLDRLNAFPAALDQENERLRHDAGLGVVPPDFIVDLALTQLQDLAGESTDQSSLVAPLIKRVAVKAIAGNYAEAAAVAYERNVRPALQRQIGELKRLRSQAGPDAGIWRLKNGDALYAALLNQATTKTTDPKDVHDLGLDLVRRITADIDAAMRVQGLTSGTVGARLRGMFEDPRFRYPNTDESRAVILKDVSARIRHIHAELSRSFRVLPKAEVIVRRIPPAIEGGSFFAYYDNPSFDGSRPGIFWLNLLDTSETPKWLIPTIIHHESVPGHHLQASIAQEAASLPAFLKALDYVGAYTVYTANSEGWALYAEQLADEWGLYADDPWARIGYLHDDLLRAARLVVDTGIHAFRWSRERALNYFIAHLGDPDRKLANEINRYCVWPGQACSYTVGKIAWLGLRERARRELGPRFDIKTFHDEGLLIGPVPLAVLEGVIEDYIRREQR